MFARRRRWCRKTSLLYTYILFKVFYLAGLSLTISRNRSRMKLTSSQTEVMFAPIFHFRLGIFHPVSNQTQVRVSSNSSRASGYFDPSGWWISLTSNLFTQSWSLCLFYIVNFSCNNIVKEISSFNWITYTDISALTKSAAYKSLTKKE